MNFIEKNWDNPISEKRLELVFQNRNQAYGAYTLRRDYNQTITKAVFITFSSLFLLVIFPSLLSYFRPEATIIKDPTKEIIVDLKEIILPDEFIPLPEKPDFVKPEPQGSTRQFSNLVVRDSTFDDKNLSQDELSKLTISTKTNLNDSVPTTDPLPDPVDNKETGTSNVHLWVEEMPTFPGGESAMMAYLSSNIKYPSTAREENLVGIVYISFIVDKQGDINNIELLKGIGGGCEEEAIRVIKKMPRWRAGKQNGQAVNVQYKLPISFTLR